MTFLAVSQLHSLFTLWLVKFQLKNRPMDEQVDIVQYCEMNIVMMDGTSFMIIKSCLLFATFQLDIVHSTDFFILT